MLFKIIPKTFKFTRLVFNIALIMFPIGIGLTLIGEKMEPAESSDNTSENTEISTEINEFDPFSEIDFTFSDTDDMGNEYIYPSKFRVTVSSKDKSLAALYEENVFNAVITRAGTETFTIKITVPEYQMEKMKEFNLVPTITEKEFNIPVSSARMNLISQNQLTEKNRELITESIKNKISETVPDVNSDFEIVKCYMTATNPDIDFLQNGYTTENAMLQSNICNILGSGAYMYYCILKNADEQYFLTDCTPKFREGLVDTESLEIRLSTYCPEDIWNPSSYYPSEQSAYNDMIKKSESVVAEIY